MPRMVLFNSFAAVITASSGVIVGWVRYLCLKNTVSLTISALVLDMYSRKLTFQCDIQTLYACPSSYYYLLARVLGLGIRQGPMGGACNNVGHGCEHM